MKCLRALEVWHVPSCRHELLGTVLQNVPPGYTVVVISDHGFEKLDGEVNLIASGPDDRLTDIKVEEWRTGP